MGLNVLSSLTTACAVTLTTVMGVAPAGAAPNEIPTADAALAKLMEGNARFVSGDMQHPNLSAERRAELAKGQAPYAVIVSCSDSRVPPELVFDAGPGDLFVIRVAGNIVGDDAQASIEYAVGVLKTPLVLVMGHESCGAVGAAVKTQTEGTEFPGSIHDLVETIRPSVETAMERAEGDELLEAAIEDNAERVVHEVSDSKPFLDQAIAESGVQVLAGRYDLDTGEVTLYDGAHGEAHMDTKDAGHGGHGGHGDHAGHGGHGGHGDHAGHGHDEPKSVGPRPGSVN